jgi:fucose 4-O-acetylase-like acetyltransferase
LRFTQPYWILWFLVSLLCWRLALPLVMALRGGVALAFGVALAAGLESQIGYAFGVSRTLVFLPFFCLGFAMRNVRLPEMATPRNRALAVLALVGLLVLAWWLAPELDVRWLYGSIGYAELGVTRATGIAARLAWQVAALLAGMAWLLLVPSRRLAITELGERSLYAFVLHGFLLRLATTHGWYALLPPGPMVDFGLAAAAVALTWLLCSAPVRKLARPLVEPSLGRWLRR